MSEAAGAPRRFMSDDYGLFDAEERIAAESEQMVGMLHEAAEKLQLLSKVYRQSLREQRRLVRLSDRTQLELQGANQSLARQAAELKRLNEALREEVRRREELAAELHRQASVDVLTGTASRRHFFTLAPQLTEQCRRDGSPLSVLLIDLDHFKQINDRHGHAAGDRVLGHFGEVCRSVLRSEDLIGRLGGEEFAILLSDTPVSAAEAVASRLLRTAEEAEVQVGPDSVAGYGMSIGITQAQPDDAALDDALARADRALYQAKQHGRGCYRVYREESLLELHRFRSA